MIRSLNFFNKVNSRPCVIFACIVCLMHVAECRDIKGRVTVDSTRPLANAIVRVQAKGESVITNTDGNGTFVLRDVNASSFVLSVMQGGRVLYRSILAADNVGTIDLSHSELDRLPKDFQPVAIWAPHQDDVFILEKTGRVLRWQEGRVEPITTVRQFATPTDINGSVHGSEVSILILCKSERNDSAVIYEYSQQGRKLHEWVTGLKGCCDVAILDLTRGAVYLLAARMGAIYRLDIGNGRIDEIAHMKNSSLTGMTFDETRQIFYTCDIEGRIYERALNGKQSTTFADVARPVGGVMFDQHTNRLYFVQNDRVRWFNLLVNGLKVPQELGSKIGRVRAFEIDDRGNVWVLHSDARVIQCFSSTGVPLRTISSE